MAILMCRPDYFGVEYEINPWMHVRTGVDHTQAEEQWKSLFRTYQELGQEIELAAPVKGQPDMVFAANAALIRGRRAVLSRFRHSERQGEEPFWREVLEADGFEVHRPPDGMAFEGAGDGLFVGNRLFAGYGFRSDLEAHDFVRQVLGVEVISLQLVDPRFYHLDTCFCPLGDDVVMFAPSAFSEDSARRIRAEVAHVIEVPDEVAEKFVCNAMPVGGRLVASQGVEALTAQLAEAGYTPIALPMSEFMKSGGAVRCLSLPLDIAA